MCGPCEKAGRASEVRSVLGSPNPTLIVPFQPLRSSCYCCVNSATSCLHFALSFLRLATVALPGVLFLALCRTQCTWGKETAKKARTQQHFESLENYIRALEAKVKDLQSEVENCRRNHGGPSPAPSSDAARDESLPRPDSLDVDASTDGDHTSSNSDSDIDTLISPTKHLLVRSFSVLQVVPLPRPASVTPQQSQGKVRDKMGATPLISQGSTSRIRSTKGSDLVRRFGLTAVINVPKGQGVELSAPQSRACCYYVPETAMSRLSSPC